MELETALNHIQGRGAIHYAGGLRKPIDVWTTEKLPIAVRRAIRAHRQEIVSLMHAGDSRVCPNRALHKRYHRRGVCLMCQRLEERIAV